LVVSNFQGAAENSSNLARRRVPIDREIDVVQNTGLQVMVVHKNCTDLQLQERRGKGGSSLFFTLRVGAAWIGRKEEGMAKIKEGRRQKGTEEVGIRRGETCEGGKQGRKRAVPGLSINPWKGRDERKEEKGVSK
jgi:hypothetical protein